MATTEESDELHGRLLAEQAANIPAQPNFLPTTAIPVWSFTAPSSSLESPSASPALASSSTSMFTQRPPRPTSDLEPSSSDPNLHHSSLFNTPSRSIFSSGPTTTSVSADTAHAMGGPQAPLPCHPLSALATSTSSAKRRSVHYRLDDSSFGNSQILRSEKENDDPSTPIERSRNTERRETSTPTALTHLFTSTEPETPTISRHASYMRTTSGTSYTRASHETASLPSHLFLRGLTQGRHSDITIHAFGTQYPLHRLLLDRAPYFSSMLSGAWAESSKRDVILELEDLDSNITQAAFELALKRLYGCNVADEENSEAIGLFATGCWLEMNDLIESSVRSILRQMAPSNLGSMIRLVTSNYYGSAGDRILSSAKAMLCKEGWGMPGKYWDSISGEIIREVIGNDGFFIRGEWERWMLAKKVFNRRLKSLAVEAGLVEPGGHHRRTPPNTMNFNAIRFDAVYRKSMPLAGRPIPEAYDPWLALYTCPDISALLVLLDEGIHYVHLEFEQLKEIKEQRDVLGLPLMPEGVISNALWTQMELRQQVLGANEHQQELGLTKACEYRDEYPAVASNLGSDSKGKQAEVLSPDAQAEEMDSGSWDGNGQPRKFWVPHVDHTSVLGGNSESMFSESGATRSYTPRHLNRLSANLEPQDVQWASDFAAMAGDRPQTPGGKAAETQPISYSLFPPFRFAVAFPNPRSLKEKKRVYSRTVWYAGSYWNVYIQKIETSKNTQLGVYLHRAKDNRDNNEDDSRHGTNVFEGIGRVELHMRRNQRQRQAHQRQNTDARADADEEAGASSGDPDATLVPPFAETSRDSAISSLIRGDPIRKSSQNQLLLSSLPDLPHNPSPLSDTDDPYASFDHSFGLSNYLQSTISSRKPPIMPPYVDARPTIKTYFKIFSPSKGGRMIATYESAPDKFDFSQSWGWKSNAMILDDGFPPPYDSNADGGREAKANGPLRFMVVIGNV